jgi:hypothetical protein
MEDAEVCNVCGIETTDYIGVFHASGLKHYCKSCYAKR